ncbi:MAG: 2-aminoethylphosphonate--pyruvate transaminase, partial [Trueperaceae bacterium]
MTTESGRATSRTEGVRSKDKLLFTPGPLTTSDTVKAAMLRDLGSRDGEFIAVVAEIRRMLLQLAGQSTDARYSAIPLQGSGTFGIEAVLSSCVSPTGKVLFIVNGAYGRRMVQMAEVLAIDHAVLHVPENRVPDPAEVDEALQRDPGLAMVALVHCETTTGIMNPVTSIGELARRHGKQFFVDAMSSFGAVPLDVEAAGVTYLVSSANKCIEGVPGFSFVIADKEALLGTDSYARSLSFDLLAQYRGLETSGQFRFTPPVQAMLAFHQALLELAEEGGVEGRGRRYRENHRTVVDGMRRLGFEPYLEALVQGPIITTFRYPEHPEFDFDLFYEKLNRQGFVIYPGKLTDADCFRIGNIGRLYPSDMK